MCSGRQEHPTWGITADSQLTESFCIDVSQRRSALFDEAVGKVMLRGFLGVATQNGVGDDSKRSQSEGNLAGAPCSLTSRRELLDGTSPGVQGGNCRVCP